MQRRAPRLLWRHLAFDLVRLTTITTLILVFIIAFGASIKFLADGKIDLGGAIIVMSLALIPMLQYALPFAGGFAATLTYNRFASDNEASAAMSGGVSHKALLVPAGVVGAFLLVISLLLAHQIIPHFLRMMERRVRSDVTGVLQRTITRGDSIQFGPLQIHADQMVPMGPDDESGAIDRFHLKGVLAIQTDRERDVEGFISAQSVNAWLFEENDADGPVSTVQLQFNGASGNWDQKVIDSSSVFTRRVAVSDTFVEDPKFNTWGELRTLRRLPENLRPIESLRRVLALRLAQRQLILDIRARLTASGMVTFTRPGGETVVVSASDLEPDGDRWQIVPRPEEDFIRIDRKQEGLTPFAQIAEGAWLEFDSGAPGGKGRIPRAVVAIIAPGAKAVDHRAARGSSALRQTTIASLELVSNRPAPTRPITVHDALAESTRVLDGRDDEFAALIGPASYILREQNKDLQREITSKMHERAAYGMACLLTVITGALAAMRLKDALPLPVYLLSFFPALAAVISIGAGQGHTHVAGWPGLIILWGGLALLAAFAINQYIKLCRH